MGLPPSKYPPKNQKSGFRWAFLSVYSKIGLILLEIGLKWVAVARLGLKLWENDATGLRIIIKLLIWPPEA